MDKLCKECLCGKFCCHRHSLMEWDILIPSTHESKAGDVPALSECGAVQLTSTIMDACIHLHDIFISDRAIRNSRSKWSRTKDRLRRWGNGLRRLFRRKASDSSDNVHGFPRCECPNKNCPKTFKGFQKLSKYSERALSQIQNFVAEILKHLVDIYMTQVLLHFYQPRPFYCTLIHAFHPDALSVDFRWHIKDKTIFSKPKIDEEFVQLIVQKCPKLEKLYVPSFKLSKCGVKILQALENLQWVDLRYSYDVPPAEIAHLLDALPKLVYLYYWEMTRVLDHLEKLNWQHSPYNLRYLCLQYPKKVHLSNIVNHFPNIVHFTIQESYLSQYFSASQLQLSDLSILSPLKRIKVHTRNRDWMTLPMDSGLDDANFLTGIKSISILASNLHC